MNEIIIASLAGYLGWLVYRIAACTISLVRSQRRRVMAGELEEPPRKFHIW